MISDATIRSNAEEVMDAINCSKIAEGHLSGHPNMHGLTIYFPSTKSDYKITYNDLAFAYYTHWDEFLKAYLGCEI